MHRSTRSAFSDRLVVAAGTLPASVRWHDRLGSLCPDGGAAAVTVMSLVGEDMLGEHTFERGGISCDVAPLADADGYIERTTARIYEQMRCRCERL